MQPAAKPLMQALLQSVLLDKFLRLKPFTTHQPIQLNPRQAHSQQAATVFGMGFALYRTQIEELRT
jgi:hypothetical protein